MRLIDNWRHIAAYSWSSRLAWLAAACSSLEILMPALQGVIPANLVQPGTLTKLALLVSASAAVARLIAQPSLIPTNDTKPA